MVGGRNDRRHRRGLSPAMAPPTMEPRATVRGGHGFLETEVELPQSITGDSRAIEK
uniref:Uncharacterized protein n=1 Tax=Vitis vinifera TaxID=29760 RepID=F6HB14_VITVI